MVALGPVAAGGLKESNFSFDSNCKNMDDLNEFCKANQLFKTTLVIGGVTIPPENLPCFEFLVLLAIIVFLLLFILIVYCCYRCRLKKRWAMPLCKNLADNNWISYFQKKRYILFGSSSLNRFPLSFHNGKIYFFFLCVKLCC